MELEIGEVGGVDYKKQKEEIDALNNEINKVDRMLTRFKTTLESSESNVRKFDTEIEKNEDEI